MTEASRSQPFLTIALSTTAERFASIDLAGLPADPAWRYLVNCQGLPTTSETEVLGGRVDVIVRPSRSTGVAPSRNEAIACCLTEALLFTDDDVTLRTEGLLELVQTLRSRPDLDLLTGRSILSTGRDEKLYPTAPRPLTLFNSAGVGTIEMAVRPRRIREAGISFDTSFGAGTENFLGDEYIFIADCLRAGLTGEFCPILLAEHRGPSSGADFQSIAATRARARVFERVFGRALAPPIKVAFVFRHHRQIGSWPKMLRYARLLLFGNV